MYIVGIYVYIHIYVVLKAHHGMCELLFSKTLQNANWPITAFSQELMSILVVVGHSWGVDSVTQKIKTKIRG